MARTDYETFAQEIIHNIGGKQNIVNITHCATRLRFVLSNDRIVDDDVVGAIKGVLGIVREDSQYQIILGLSVRQVYPFAKKIFESPEDDESNSDKGKLGGLFKLFKKS